VLDETGLDLDVVGLDVIEELREHDPAAARLELHT